MERNVKQKAAFLLQGGFRRGGGFAFGPFLAVGLGLWLVFGIPFTDKMIYPDMDLDISAIAFVNDHHANYYETYREHMLELAYERRLREYEAGDEENEADTPEETQQEETQPEEANQSAELSSGDSTDTNAEVTPAESATDAASTAESALQ